jgi:hypothetical protein
MSKNGVNLVLTANINNPARTYGRSSMNTNNDPMEDIREIRHQISNEFGHNPKSYIDYLKSTKKNYAAQLRLYEKSSDIKLQYDFSDVAGKLEWQGNAVQEQRKIRNEW